MNAPTELIQKNTACSFSEQAVFLLCSYIVFEKFLNEILHFFILSIKLCEY